MGRTCALMLSWLIATSAHAETVGLVVDVDGGPFSQASVQSVAWHAIMGERDHDALLLGSDGSGWVGALQSHQLTTLIHLDVSWRAQVVRLEGGAVAAPSAPEVRATELVLVDGELVSKSTWLTVGAAAIYSVDEDVGGGFVSLPEVALQEALSVAMEPVRPPVWRTETADPVVLDVELVADEEYRAYYGAAWPRIAGARVERASRILKQAGVALRVTTSGAWTSPAGTTDLTDLLTSMARTERQTDAVLRLGFTQQTGLASSWSETEDVGRAYVPGRDVVVADQAAPPGHLAAWDEVEEAIAIAHEVLHALGVPHLDDPYFLMSAEKGSVVHVLAPSTRELARAAAQARAAHWDARAALAGLASAAERHLADEPELQLDYITDNLAEGPGVPRAGSVSPEHMSALGNTALARHYLASMHEGVSDMSTLRQSALAHSTAALRMRPALPAAREIVAALARQPASSLALANVAPPAASPAVADSDAEAEPCGLVSVWDSCPDW